MRCALAGNQVLPAFFEVAFDHHAGDAALAGFNARGEVGADVDLAPVVDMPMVSVLLRELRSLV